MEENKNYITENKKLNDQITELEDIYKVYRNDFTNQKDKLIEILNGNSNELSVIINELEESFYKIENEITSEIKKRENLIEENKKRYYDEENFRHNR